MTDRFRLVLVCEVDPDDKINIDINLVGGFTADEDLNAVMEQCAKKAHETILAIPADVGETWERAKQARGEVVTSHHNGPYRKRN
jgi:hypothetical protein